MGDDRREQREEQRPQHDRPQEEPNGEVENQEEADDGMQLMQLNNIDNIEVEFVQLLANRMYEDMGFLRRIIEQHGFSYFANIISSLQQRRNRNRGVNIARDVVEGTNETDTDSDENDDDSGSDFTEDIRWLETENVNELYKRILPIINSETDISTLKKLYRFFLEEKLNHFNKLYSFQPLKLIKVQYKYWCSSGEFPTARSGHRVVATNSHLYSLGGYNPHRTPLRRLTYKLYQELWSYNFATKRWKLVLHPDNCNMPLEQASIALISHNNLLISYGGTGFPFGERCSNDCYIYKVDHKPEILHHLQVSGNIPTAQYGPGIVIHDNYLYTIGGTTGFEYSCDVHRLNFSNNVWEIVYQCRPDIRDDPEGRYRHEIVYDGKYIYIFGGGTSNTVFDLQHIPAFDLQSNQWQRIETLPDKSLILGDNDGYPKARKCLTCVYHTNSLNEIEVFITGGLQGDFTTYFADIWKLNLRSKRWLNIRTASLPNPMYFHSATHDGNGCMYIFGGIQYNDGNIKRSNSLFKMWMTIPKLSEICWEAVTHYNKNLHLFEIQTLRAEGIPEKFIARLPIDREHFRPKAKQMFDEDL